MFEKWPNFNGAAELYCIRVKNDIIKKNLVTCVPVRNFY